MLKAARTGRLERCFPMRRLLLRESDKPAIDFHLLRRGFNWAQDLGSSNGTDCYGRGLYEFTPRAVHRSSCGDIRPCFVRVSGHIFACFCRHVLLSVSEPELYRSVAAGGYAVHAHHAAAIVNPVVRCVNAGRLAASSAQPAVPAFVGVNDRREQTEA